jgi:hypothetical protein
VSLELPWTECPELPWKTELELEAGSSLGGTCCGSLRLRALASIVAFASLEVLAVADWLEGRLPLPDFQFGAGGGFSQ